MKVSTPDSIVAALYSIAAEIRALANGTVSPTSAQLCEYPQLLEIAADELSRQIEITRRWLRMTRTASQEATQLHSVLDELETTSVRVYEIERALVRAEQRGEERVRRDSEAAACGFDWALARMNARSHG